MKTCNNIAISASYNWHSSFKSAVDDAVLKAASDISKGRNIWSLNSYRSKIDYSGLSYDNLKFVHPFILNSGKERLVIPEIVFQLLSSVKTKCDVGIIGNQDIKTIVDVVNSIAKSDIKFVSEDSITSPSSSRLKLAKLHYDEFEIGHEDPIMFVAGDIPFFYNMLPQLSVEDNLFFDFRYSINPQEAIWRGKDEMFSRNFYWPISYNVDGEIISTKTKEGNWEIEDYKAIKQISYLFDLMYNNRKGGEATKAIANLVFSKVKENPKEFFKLLSIGKVLFGKPVSIENLDGLLELILNSKGQSRIFPQVVINDDPFALKDYDALNEDFVYFNSVLQAAVNKYGLKNGLEQITPFATELIEIGKYFAKSNSIPLVANFPEIIELYISSANVALANFPDGFETKIKSKYFERIRNSRVSPLHDTNGNFNVELGNPNEIEKTINYLETRYVPKFKKEIKLI
ncbi:hypothetical protein JXM83_06935 [Candidatus Woesearchaeota archaeon]|nr:hypothetical protein [Candidatus Woesearchaeota archaeon]